jgi:hypothetical protein
MNSEELLGRPFYGGQNAAGYIWGHLGGQLGGPLGDLGIHFLGPLGAGHVWRPLWRTLLGFKPQGPCIEMVHAWSMQIEIRAWTEGSIWPVLPQMYIGVYIASIMGMAKGSR